MSMSTNMTSSQCFPGGALHTWTLSRNGKLATIDSLRFQKISYRTLQLGSFTLTSAQGKASFRGSTTISACSMTPPEEKLPLTNNELEAKLDLQLPRRRLKVSFTCDACGVRSHRLINPNAYARGTVFIQCSGCEAYHKLVDNLGLIEEYDFREESAHKDGENNPDSSQQDKLQGFGK